MSLALRNYQETAVTKGLHNSFILGDECGLGKTAVGITLCKALQEKVNSPTFRTLVIAPKRVCLQWYYEIEKWHPGAKRIPLWYGLFEIERDGYYIIHPEVLQRSASHLNVLWDTIIVDEAHRFKNRKTLRWPLLKGLHGIHRFCLTGTPLEYDPRDLWTLLHFVAPQKYPNYWRFVNRHCIMEKHPYLHFKEYKGIADHDKLALEIAPQFLKRTKAQVNPELPEKIEVDMPITMNGEQRALYDAITERDDVEVRFRGEDIYVPNELSKLMLLQRVSSLPQQVHPEMPLGAKLEWLDDFIENDMSEPLLIFTRFVESAKYLAVRYGAAFVAGGKELYYQEFLEGKCDILTGTIASLGEGLNLQRAGVAVIFETEWSYRMMTQASDRIHRMDITSKKTIYRLIASPTDKLMFDCVAEKWDEHQLLYKAFERKVLI